MSDREQEPVEPLDEELQALVAAERDSPGMPPEVQARLLRRLTASLPGGGQGGGQGGGGASLGPRAGRPAPGWGATAILGVGTFGLGLLTGAALHARWSRPSLTPSAASAVAEGRQPPGSGPPAPAAARPPAAAAPAAAVPVAAAPLKAPLGKVAPASAARAAAAAAPAAPAIGRAASESSNPPISPTTGRDFDLAAESALIERARAALLREQTAASLEALQQHQQRFAQGRLSEERESLWIQALVNTGQASAARARAAQFRQRFPQSLLLPVVDAALGALP